MFCAWNVLTDIKQPQDRFAAVQKLKQALESEAEVAADAVASKAKNRPKPTKTTREYAQFQKFVENQFQWLVRNQDFKQLRYMGINNERDLEREVHLFRSIIDKAFELASRFGQTGRKENPYFWAWRNAFVTSDARGLQTELSYSFTSFIVRQHLSKDAIACHEKLADLRYPHEWFPATRTMQRKIHLHVGPTNSGKTYNALKALEASHTGIYAGPLRLLAHETYMRFRAQGKRCALVTGEEQRIPEGDESYFASCTVEMTPLNTPVDVAVIDEIQMIGDDQRGWAWTQAVLGVQAKEVHLCGEDRAVPLIEALCAKMGDEVFVHRYQRLSSLQPMQESLRGNLENMRKGDAIVSFSRVGLHALKAGIEKATGKKCAIVYGALPPESRAQQAALFNDPDNDYDFLAASDAIGMGLNLEIKRVVFETVAKHDGMKVRGLTLPELKQIGGRAGRYRTASQAMRAPTAVATAEASSQGPPTQSIVPKQTQKKAQVGFVTTLEEEDLNSVHGSFNEEAQPIETAGLLPPSSVIERFASYFPAGTPFTFILLRLRDIARLPSLFHLCGFSSMLDVARIIQSAPLSVHDRCIFLNAPINFRDYKMTEVVRALAFCVARNSNGELLNIEEIPLEILDYSRDTYPPGKIEYLKHLESLHRALTLYLWLSYRYTGIFQSQELAFHAKALVEHRIDEYLDKLDYVPEARKKQIAEARRVLSKRRRKAEKVFGEHLEDVEDEGVDTYSVKGEDVPLLSATDLETTAAPQNTNP